MNTILTLEYDNFIYTVDVEFKYIEDSFTHAFGIRRFHYYEIESMSIIDRQDESGESHHISWYDNDLYYKLLELAEDELNA